MTTNAEIDPGGRPAELGELCTCGRQAVTVIDTAMWGEVGFCGVMQTETQPAGPCVFCGGVHRGRCSSYRLRLEPAYMAPVEVSAGKAR